MNLLKKVLWLLIASIVTLNATEQTQLCQVFDDGIQTRTNNSKIKFINNSHLFNNPDNTLNGFQVINQNTNLSCRDVNGTTDEVCQSSNTLGSTLPLMSLQVPEVFTFTEAVSNDSYIKMKNLKVKKNETLNLTADSAIYLESLTIAKNSTVTITAPKVVIGNLHSFKNSNIKIIADSIDIKIIKLENKADLIIESFTADTDLDVRIEKLKLKKASALLSNGLYHIKRVELKNRSSLSVGDSVQIVNRRTVVLNHSRINASKNTAICDDEHKPNALFIYSSDLVRVENHSKIVAMVYNDRRVELKKYSGLKGAISAKNRAIFKNHSKVCYTKCNLTSVNTDVTPPVLILNGSNNLTLQVGESYNELGATAVDNVDGNISVTVSGLVDTDTVGTYTVTYSATDSSNNEANITRTVNVVLAPDMTAPIVTLNGDSNVTLIQGSKYIELNASAIDDRDGNISVTVSGNVNTNIVGLYTLTYTATDSANNSASKTRTVNVVSIIIVDITAPVITLNGDANITLTQGNEYVELGASAVDDRDGNVSVTISGSVDTSTVGTYTVTYRATDSANNSSSKTRTIKVEEKINKIETLTLTASKTEYTRKLSYYGKDDEGKVINYYAGVSVPMQVFATFEDGNKEEVTDKIKWILSNDAKTPYGSVVLTKEGTTTVQASYQSITSNSIELILENYETKENNFLKYTIYETSIPGRGVDMRIGLNTQPVQAVTLTLELDPNDKVEFKKYVYPSPTMYTKTLTFEPGENWNATKIVEIEDKDENNTNPYVIKTHVFESEDANYEAKDPQDINIVPKSEIELIVPPIEQRRGAIRGVHISMLIKAHATNGVEFRLVDPPEGMYLSDGEYSHILDEEEMSTKRPKIIEWDVPMDAIEGQTYDITVEVTDDKKRKGSVTFPIKVPKTKLIQTEVVNNELIVTDKDSTLYGMKMKGHSGEDISELKIRSVDYGDVWKHYGKRLNISKEIEHTVFIVDNMPKITDIKFPPYMDIFEKRINIGAGFDWYSSDCLHDLNCWDWKNGNMYLYEDTNGVKFLNSNQETINSSEVFIFTINEKL